MSIGLDSRVERFDGGFVLTGRLRPRDAIAVLEAEVAHIDRLAREGRIGYQERQRLIRRPLDAIETRERIADEHRAIGRADRLFRAGRITREERDAKVNGHLEEINALRGGLAQAPTR